MREAGQRLSGWRWRVEAGLRGDGGRYAGRGVFASFPGQGQHLDDPMRGMVGQLGEDVGKPGARVVVIELAGLCRAPNYAERARCPQDLQ